MVNNYELLAVDNCLLPSVFCILSSVFCPLHLSRTLYKAPHFMQNKPNSLDARMNVSSFGTREYENLPLRRRGENKPNATPIKANFTYPQSHALPALSLSKGATPKGVEQKSDAASDLVQETWVGIIKGIRKLQDVAAFPQWAFRILNHNCTDWLRRHHVQSRLDQELARQAQDSTDNHKDGDERAESLRAAIERLPCGQRALLMLRYREDFDVSQIADILRVPEGTVKSRLHRTMERLRQLMGQE
jgi:RNA polymerase sigma-70 factor (ECF subfamily)